LSTELFTPRLRLIALSLNQLKKCLTNLSALGKELGIPISSKIIDEPVVRAINMKADKMMTSDRSLHAWFTYWLIVTKESPFGVGLIGFKGEPNAEGETEIGYGLDEAYWNRGYMTETLRAMCDWAFSQPECKAVTAETVLNPASDRVLEKLGGQIVRQEGSSTFWKIKP
jgi:ribosomal-protein-alanine N-acetyltransferase